VSNRYQVRFTPEAQADLFELYDYIAEHGSAARALHFIERIEQWCNSLECFPERGVRRDDIRPGLRVVGFGRRVSIAFHVTSDAVTIIRILYAGRDITTIFDEPPE